MYVRQTEIHCAMHDNMRSISINISNEHRTRLVELFFGKTIFSHATISRKNTILQQEARRFEAGELSCNTCYYCRDEHLPMGNKMGNGNWWFFFFFFFLCCLGEKPLSWHSVDGWYDEYAYIFVCDDSCSPFPQTKIKKLPWPLFFSSLSLLIRFVAQLLLLLYVSAIISIQSRNRNINTVPPLSKGIALKILKKKK